MMGAELVRPDDLTADNSRDLVRELQKVNVERIRDTHVAHTERVKRQDAERMSHKANHRIVVRYKKKAQRYYDKLWAECGKQPAGHQYRNHDYGYSVSVCDVCSYATHRDSYDKPKAKEYREKLIEQMAQRLIDVDVEQGLLTLPTPADFTGKTPRKKLLARKK
jgi:hypothetical protein